MSCNRIFLIFAISITFAASLAGCNNATSATPQSAAIPSSDPALALVERFNMGAGLESLASQVAHSTTTFGVIVQKHGASEAEKLVRTEIAKAIPTYQSRWNQNLAVIYATHFSPEELRSLATLGTSSPYADKFKSTHAAVGAEMRSASSPLLQQLVTEALASALKQ